MRSAHSSPQSHRVISASKFGQRKKWKGERKKKGGENASSHKGTTTWAGMKTGFILRSSSRFLFTFPNYKLAMGSTSSSSSEIDSLFMCSASSFPKYRSMSFSANKMTGVNTHAMVNL